MIKLNGQNRAGLQRTKDIDDTFLLAANEYEDLCFTKRRIPRSDLVAHEYLSCELERRAWEKYGGQVGLDAARVRRREQLDAPVNALAAPARNEDVNNRNVNGSNSGRKRSASQAKANLFDNLASSVQDIHIRRVEGISPSLPAIFSSISNSLSPSPQRSVNNIDNLFSRPHHLFASGSTSGGSAFQASDLMEFCKSFDVNEDHGTPEASPSPAKRRRYSNAGADTD
ncbi:hypothetical protein D9613_008448 [Agrocybe pediades]|uniref:Uncharacterized protein n=1 Tax=Agrocybe pediades TaxID=84607 RepID=A0A8H4QS00_9AGAR|nr:hypothetical protein D9613_008448 [Agrocybe pediades]